MEELIKEKCEDYGIDPSILTDSERSQLIREIEAEQRGDIILDSVLDSPDILFRSEE